MKKVTGILAMFLSVLMVFGSVGVLMTNAEEPPLRMELTTDKASYGLRDTVRLHVQVFNDDSKAYKDVSVMLTSTDYGFPENRSNTVSVGTLKANGTASADYALIVSRQFGGLNVFQRIALFFRYLIRKFVQISGVQIGGMRYIAQTLTITQNGRPATVEVYVTYGETVTSEDPTDPGEDPQPQSGFSLTMLDVGQGLSILVQSDGHAMLYDGGGRSASSYVVAYLKAHGVSALDAMIASHYDEDHLAGLVGVLNTTSVQTAYTPDYTADTAIYQSFVSKLAANGAAEKHPAVGETFSCGGSTVQFISPANYAYRNENSFSLVVRITYGAFSCVMTGDAEKDAEADMVSNGYAVDSDLLVVGHHGSSSSSSEGFIQAVKPEYAFISVGAGNAYKHPTAQTLSTLNANHVQIFRSDESGEVTCYSDGVKYWFSTEPSKDWTEGSYTLTYDANGGSGAPSVQSGAKTYTVSSVKPVRSGWTFLGWSKSKDASSASYLAGNKITVTDNTVLYAVWQKEPEVHKIYRTRTGKKYHYNPNCGSGTYYECTLEEALAAGLTPCEKCVHD